MFSCAGKNSPSASIEEMCPHWFESSLYLESLSRTSYFITCIENKFVCVLPTIYWCLMSRVYYLCLWQKEQGKAAPIH